MLVNGRALAQLCTDDSYEAKLSGTLFLLQDGRWRSLHGILKANLLFLFSQPENVGIEAPCIILILEDCYIELCDDNATRRLTGRKFIFAADSFKALERWISSLTVASLEYIAITKQSFLEQISDISSLYRDLAFLWFLFIEEWSWRLKRQKMPAYHSKFTDVTTVVGNMAILPIRSSIKGPAPRTDDGEDIIDEALAYFKPNIFFANTKLKSSNRSQAIKDLSVLALSHHLPIPGEASFPLNSMYKAPANRNEEDIMRSYLLQLRQELGARLLEHVFDTNNEKPSKWWMCFARRRFMDKGLVSPGIIL
ncbi:putative actin-related protein 2/3 complex subunit 3 [Dirofilaria immitis]|nr:putative actin-related protein 2/3 complex subunit 3 [Dirofilaria immitis]